MFCAPRRRLESRMALETPPSAVNGGQTTMSTSLTLANSILRSLIKSSASATVLFIFQLPATISLRSLFIWNWRLLITQRRYPRQDPASEELKTGAAAGAHEGDFVAQPGLVESLDAVAAANDALGAIFLSGFSHRASDGIGAVSKTLVLKQTHRAVPEDGLGFEDHLGVSLNGSRADVQARRILRTIWIGIQSRALPISDRLALLVQLIGLDRRRHHVVGGQQELRIPGLGFGQRNFGDVHFVWFHQRCAHSKPLRQPEGVSHGAADQNGVGLFEQTVYDLNFV